MTARGGIDGNRIGNVPVQENSTKKRPSGRRYVNVGRTVFNNARETDDRNDKKSKRTENLGGSVQKHAVEKNARIIGCFKK